MIYFDNAATTLQKPPEVGQAVIEAMHSLGNSGRGAHAATLSAARKIYQTRELLARLFHAADPQQIAFTSNSTESLNTAIMGLCSQGDHVITTACEHNSVLRPLYRLEAEGTIALTIIPADQYGTIDYEELEQSCRLETKAVVITHASNLTGVVTDIRRVSRFAREHGLLLIVDASQTAGSYPIDVEELGIDILCFTGHKGLMGPQGTGGIYVRKGIDVRPLKVGGSGVHSFDHEHPAVMPTALEAGTLNGHGIAGLDAGVRFILDTGVDKIHAREMKLAQQFVDGIRDIPEIHMYGHWEHRRKSLTGQCKDDKTAVRDGNSDDNVAIVTLNLGDCDSALLADELWEQYEMAVRAGAHCAPLMHEALGTDRQGAVRFSFSYYNTEAEVETAVWALHELAEE